MTLKFFLIIRIDSNQIESNANSNRIESNPVFLSLNRIELKLERIESNRITLKFDSIRFVQNLILDIISATNKVNFGNYEKLFRHFRFGNNHLLRESISANILTGDNIM